MPNRPRIIVALSDLTESATLSDWLVASGFDPVRKTNPRAAAEEMQARGFDLLVAEVSFAFRDGLHALSRQRNPNTPTVVIGSSATEPREVMGGHSMYLARPVDQSMLVCFVSMAIMDGRPARRSIRKSVNRFAAIANGVPSHLVDISLEGLRLEVPPSGQALLPPYFRVQVPALGVSVSVQRMWTKPGIGRGATLYGGALAQNRTLAEQAWRTMVDTIPVVGVRSPMIQQVD